MERKKPLKFWEDDEKPREKLIKKGEHNLTDTELLAILLRSGTKGETAIDLARKIINKFGSFRNMSHTSINNFKEIKGLGIAKICQIKAAIEIGRRMVESEFIKREKSLTSPDDVVKYIMPRMRDLKKEVFKVIHLDSKNRPIEIREIEEGTVNQANPIIREIFYKAIENFIPTIICIHNHPSGDPSPSKEDIEFTKRLKEAGEILGINVLDHLIIGDNIYYSFTSGKIKKCKLE
ncbi:MAG: DNA repair protein RadC [Candidatus Omnitrophica bacterium]|nr:DNA repair protein RadC [Candidatus Omnitrophota bacterium]MCM8810608.1 DNA repair protein RadC [Candidatus Omnitrophota bacterium]